MKKTIKVRKLRGWVKVTLASMAFIAIFGAFYGMLSIGFKRIDNMYNECDNARGYACDYYEARQYALKGE